MKDIIVAYYFGGEELSLSQRETIRLISLFLASFVNIGASIWLYFESRKEKHKAYVWALFGLFFGLIAVAIYYLVNIYNRLNTKSGVTDFIKTEQNITNG